MSEGWVTDGKKKYRVKDVAGWLQDHPDMTEATNLKDQGKTSVGEAVVLGAAQGAGFGFPEESEGLINYVLTKAGVRGYPERAKTRGLGSEAWSPEDYVGEAREKYTQAEKDRPGTYLAADLVAGIPAAIATGGKSLEGQAARGIPKLVQLGRAAAPAAGMGFVEGVGRSEGGAKERALGGAEAAAFSVAAPPALKALASRPAGRAVLGAGAGYAAGEGISKILPNNDKGDPRDVSGITSAIGAALGLSPKLAIKAYTKIKGAGKSQEIKETMDALFDMTPKGKELRQAAKRGETAAMKTVQELQERVSRQLELDDQIRAYAHTGMKPEYVKQAMVVDFGDRALKYAPQKSSATAPTRPASIKNWETPSSLKMSLKDGSTSAGSPAARRRLQSADTDPDLRFFDDTMPGQTPVSKGTVSNAFDDLVSTDSTDIEQALREGGLKHLEEVYTNVHEMADLVDKFADQLKDARITALSNKLKNDVRLLRERYASLPVVASAGDKAQAFIDLDKLKQRMYSIAKSLDRSTDSNSGALAEEAWRIGADKMLPNLENAELWGEGAARLQKEVNAVWHPYLTARMPTRGERGFNRFVSHRGAEPSARIGRTRGEGDPRELSTMIKEMGAPENVLREKSFRKGISTSTELGEGLAKHYGNKPELTAKAAEMRSNQDAIMTLLEKSKGETTAYRDLESLSKLGGPIKPSTVARGMTIMDDMADSIPARAIGKGAKATIDAAARNPSNVGAYDYAKSMWGDRPIPTTKAEEKRQKQVDALKQLSVDKPKKKRKMVPIE